MYRFSVLSSLGQFAEPLVGDPFEVMKAEQMSEVYSVGSCHWFKYVVRC